MMHSPFDAIADQYDATTGGEQRGDKYATELSARMAPGGGRLLELGVGTGVVTLGLRRRGHNVVGLDLSSGMLRKARERNDNPFVRADACRLPFGDGVFTNVVSVWMVQ